MLLVRQNLAKPSDATGEHEHTAQHADACVSDEAGRGEHATEGQDDGPRSGRGKIESLRRVAYVGSC